MPSSREWENLLSNHTVLGVALSAPEYAVLVELAKQNEPIKVVPLSKALADRFSDAFLYTALEKMANNNLVLKEPKTERLKGHVFNQVYWSATERAKAAVLSK
jgi:predicted transcriptional regulator